LFFVGTDLLARAANQGVEQAFFSTLPKMKLRCAYEITAFLSGPR